jgi:hypothetical protein
MWLLVRLAFFALTLVPPGVGDGSATPHPAGVIVLSAFLSVAEWRRRSESAFWRNFGVSLHMMAAIALATAIAGEIIIFAVVRYVIPHR